MTSAIDPSKPTFGVAFTADVRNNFQIAANEITALQALGPFLALSGGTMTGPIVLAADPTTSLQAATKQYVDAHAGGGLPAATQYDQLVYVGGAWTNQRARYILGCFVPGTMTASQMLLLHRFTKAVTIPANFGTYLGHVSEARGTVNATASTTIIVQQSLSGTPATFTNVGTIAIAGGTMVGTFASSGGTAIGFAQGDALALVGPASADTTFANFAATLVGFET